MDSERVSSVTEYSTRKYYARTAQESLSSDYFGNLLNTDSEAEESDETENEGVTSSGFSISETMDSLRSKITDIQTKTLSQTDDLHEQIKKLREECIDWLIRLLFPDKIDNFRSKYDDEGSGNSLSDALSSSEAYSSPKSSLNYQVAHISLDSEYYYEESESTSFSAAGTVKCADGSEISFGINIEMSRSFSEYYSEKYDILDVSLTDPLVINFDGNISELSDQTFYFDIDSDGVEDEISRLLEGSGFLALDLDENGKIDNGSELFGTSSGDGFKDLSIYDTDNDGWIDEDDEIFDKLKIMTVDENGEMTLYSLKDKNIGAIGLTHIDTTFSLKSLEDNSTAGVIRSTGVFLTEDGNVGNVQQVDFARRQKLLSAYA